MAQIEVKLKNQPEPKKDISKNPVVNVCPNNTADQEAKPDQDKDSNTNVIKHKLIEPWSTDKIVAVGLVVMGIMSIVGYIAYALLTGRSDGMEIPMAIVSGLTGFLGRGVVSNEHQNHHLTISAPQQSPMVQKEGGVPNGCNESCPNR